MKKRAQYIIQGMNRDMSDSKASAEFSYENKNIRLTAHSGDTLLSVTNERGNKKIGGITLEGTFLGKCVLNNNLIVFTTKEDSQKDYIYKITLNDNGTYTTTTLVNGLDLKFDAQFPIEAIGIKETELVQKVYWVDGKNQPRVIDITKSSYTNTDVFNFVRELQLQENVEIVRKEGTDGLFPPGVVQYAFSYYTKHGQESNLFYTSRLQYTSASTRGLAPNDLANCSFQITINNLDTNFDFVKIYSIKRSSLNATPECKLVTEIPVTKNLDRSLTYIDSNNSGEIIDPTLLFYIGGESIIANTLTHKDNTLFLGNITLNSHSVASLLASKNIDLSNDPEIYAERRVIPNSEIDITGSYPYRNQLKEADIRSFKSKEKYRLGVQFQDSTGKWSLPVFLKDVDIQSDSMSGGCPSPDLSLFTESNTGDISSNPLSAIQLRYRLDADQAVELINAGYKKARGVVVYPSPSERHVVAQGVLCPTVYNAEDRFSNAPFAQSSWFTRPISPDPNPDDYYNKDYIEVFNGMWAEYRHNYPIPPNYKRNGEIQSIGYMPDSVINSFENYEAREEFVSKNREAFYVDQSILTFHSPDIELDVTSYDWDRENFSLGIIGIVEFTGNASDIDIQTSSGPYNPKGTGITLPNIVTSNISKDGYKSLLSGYFYVDSMQQIEDDSTIYWRAFNVYPWHRTGALNSDRVVKVLNSEELEIEKPLSAKLESKIISNLKYSARTRFFNQNAIGTINSVLYDITPVSVFSSDQVSLLKIPSPREGAEDICYFGNVDKLCMPNIGGDKSALLYLSHSKLFSKQFNSKEGYPIIQSSVYDDAPSSFYWYSKAFPAGVNYTDNESYSYGTEPVLMRYKSSPHAVFALKPSDNISGVNILPSLLGTNLGENLSFTEYPYWENKDTYIDSIYYESFYMASDTVTSSIFIDKEVKYVYGTNSENVTTMWEYSDVNGVFENTTTFVTGSHWKDQSSYHYVVVDNGGSKTLETITLDKVYYVQQQQIPYGYLDSQPLNYGYLYLAELYRNVDNPFGGDSEYAKQNNIWIPAGEPITLSSVSDNNIYYIDGDAFIQRYDCLKTYAFADGDPNSIVEIISFLCESRVNIDGRYDRNRGNTSNLYANPSNFNLINHNYRQENNFFNYQMLDEEIFSNNMFPNTVTWSKEKQAGEVVDTWTNITMASILDLDGDKGNLNSLTVFNNEIYAFQDKGFSNILFNSRVQIPTSDSVPIEISNGLKVSGKRYISNTVGCQNKWSIAESPLGLYFIDDYSNDIYVYNGQLASLTNKLGFSNWKKETASLDVWNPVDFNNFITFYDLTNGDVYFVNKETCLVYTESLGQFTSFMSYEETPAMFNIEDKFFSIKNNSIWAQNEGDYNYFYDEFKPFYIQLRVNPEMPLDKIFTGIEFRSDSWDENNELVNDTFDYLSVNNEYQEGETFLTNSKDLNKTLPVYVEHKITSSLKRKFRIWRANIPRDKDRNRIRNTWTYLKLAKLQENKNRTVLHDIIVDYYIQ